MMISKMAYVDGDDDKIAVTFEDGTLLTVLCGPLVFLPCPFCEGKTSHYANCRLLKPGESRAYAAWLLPQMGEEDDDEDDDDEPLAPAPVTYVTMACSVCGCPYKKDARKLDGTNVCSGCLVSPKPKYNLPKRTGEARIEHLIEKPAKDAAEHFDWFMSQLENAEFDSRPDDLETEE